MQRLQRVVGRALPRTADETQVRILLKDFEDVDAMLDSLIAASKAWRDAWKQILMRQQKVAAEFDGLYNPIVGTGNEAGGSIMVETPEHISMRTLKLAQEYADLEADMKDEVDEMDLRVIRPAEDAKAWIQPMKKVIKKRQDRKLDYERYQGRYDAQAKKFTRSERENRALGKHEVDLAKSKEEYAAADSAIKERLPPLIATVFSLLPYILTAQITIQNNLLGHCYTQILDFCQQEGFPVPAPPMPDLITAWETDYLPIKSQVETLKIVKKGRPMHHQPHRANSWNPDSTTRRVSAPSRVATLRPEAQPALDPLRSPPPSDVSSTSPVRSPAPPSPDPNSEPNNLSRVDSNNSGHLYEFGRQKMLSAPDQGSLAQSMPNYAKPALRGMLTPDTLGAMSPAGPNADYFSRGRTPSAGSSLMSPPVLSPTTSTVSSPGMGAASMGMQMQGALAAAAAAKKKPPPPPGPKPQVGPRPGAVFVTALYDFAGQSHGDLTFREGDRIKVIKRTESTQDWWEGELAGVRGHFPANYCQVA